MSDRRARPRFGGAFLWLPLTLVLAVLATAFVAFEVDLGSRLGIAHVAPAEPEEVPAPEGLALPQLASPRPVAAPAATDVEVSADAVRRAVRAALNEKDFGPHVVAAVGAPDGTVWWSNDAGAGTPASLMKLVTGIAALDALGPDRTFRTSVQRTDRPGVITLVGGGDPFLATEPSEPSDWPQVADLTTLAAETAAELLNEGRTRVRLQFDDSLFEGPELSDEWESGYFPSEVSRITALWVDQGRPAEGEERVEQPARMAARRFADLLEDAGVKVRGNPRPAKQEATGEEIAGVDSPPVRQIVERVIAVSDNSGAESLARHVGIAEGTGADFDGGTRGVRAVLKRLDIPLQGARILDGSGLSRQNLLTADTLLAVLATAAQRDDLAGVIEGLPVAGFNGSATYRLGASNPEGLGKVRAKTGTLTGVHGFAGTVVDLNGTPMTFVVFADKVAPDKGLGARKAIDDFAAALAACRCS